jgi:glycosyltransferase involved in cell wall biosynthesis
VWYLSAGGAGAIDLPYAVPVWDLQHRVQPWFPELSADGKWDAREMYWARCLGRASIVICGTEAGKREIMDLYHVPPDRIKFLPHPTPRFALDNAQSLGDDSSSYVLGRYNLPKGYLFYPAQFWAHKNHIGVLLAVYLLRERYGIEFPVVFIGSDKGNLRYVKQEIEKLNLNDQVHFLGFVPQKDVVGLYRNAFALTYLSFFGPENLPPLEAFALGCPVIASKVPGAEEQLGNAAMLVDPKSPEQITDAIKRLHEDPLLRQALIEGGVKRALKFTGQDFVKGMFSILDEFESIRRTWSAG